MDLLAQGNAAFVDDDFDGAIQLYTRALEADANLVDAYTARAAAHLKLRRHREAWSDADSALKIRPTHEPALYRRGVACFSLDEYGEALEAFTAGQAAAQGSASPGTQDGRKYSTWLRKCHAELDSMEPAPAKPSSTAATTAPAASLGPPKYQYYQTPEKITVGILEKGLSESDVSIEFGEERLRVALNSGRVLFDRVLFDAIVPAECRARYLTSKVECVLRKRDPHEWPSLEGAPGKKAPLPTPAAAAAPASEPAPATAAGADSVSEAAKVNKPYASHRDWDAIDRDLAKELEAEKPEGEEALNDLFKQIYKNANEDTRRAMVKSFQTSGGTVLSTNWDEVKEKDYENERQAPKGMEWRTYEGDRLPQVDSD